MTNPVISVIIPAYNHERFVGAAVDSVLSQTFRDLELIVIDDGSTDGTATVVKQFQDPRLTYHYQSNQDAYNALNNGMDLARGQFIAILNSDDIYTPNRLEVLLDHQRRTQAACLFTDVLPIDAEGRQIPEDGHYWHIWHQKNRQFYFDCDDLFVAFLKGNFMVTTSNLFLTSEAVRTVGPFAPLRYLHDYDYMFRVLLAFPKRVVYLHDPPLLYYRLHDHNTLNQNAIIAREQNRDLVRKYMLADLPKNARARAAAGADRLAELERELASVRRQMRIPPPLRPAVNTLYRLLFK